jgi:hypothetical protein
MDDQKKPGSKPTALHASAGNIIIGGDDFDSLAYDSPFVLIGTIKGSGARVVLLIEEALAAPAGFGNLKGREVTIVLLTPVEPGRYVFFSDLLSVSKTLVLKEKAHLLTSNTSIRDAVNEAIARAYATRMRTRFSSAKAILLGTVGAVQSQKGNPGQDDDSVAWATAALKIEKIIVGDSGLNELILVGPLHATRRYPRTPTLKPNLRAIFILQTPPADALSVVGKSQQGNAFFISDTTDIQPVEKLSDIIQITKDDKTQTKP